MACVSWGVMMRPTIWIAITIALSTSAAAQSGDRPPVKIDTLKVTAEGSPRLRTGRDAFDERRRFGFGRFYDSTELKSRASAHVSDLLQGEHGIAVIRPPMCTAPGSPRDPNVHHNNCVTSAATRVAVTKGFCGVKI